MHASCFNIYPTVAFSLSMVNSGSPFATILNSEPAIYCDMEMICGAAMVYRCGCTLLEMVGCRGRELSIKEFCFFIIETVSFE